MRIRAIVYITVLTEEALTAESLDIDSHPVTRLYLTYRRSDRLDDSDHLMTDSYSRNSPRHTSVLYMKITGAYAAEGHSHDSILRITDHRPGLLGHFEASFSDICICFHKSIISMRSKFTIISGIVPERQ